MIIKMNDDKSLVITIPTTIYRGEQNANLITFLVPMNYGEHNLADSAMVMRYILSNGEGKSEPLSYLPEPYKNYLQFSTVANTRLTSEDGEITLWLTAFNTDDDLVLKTGEIIINITPSKDIVDYMPKEELDELDALTAKIAELMAITDELDDEKADSIVYDSETKMIQLASDGELIGDSIDMSRVVEDNETYSAEDAESESAGVIYF